ncbi:MAG: hypothetical protein COA33_008165 [Fluviicola sp.]|nr:hypothetical protein [Fluviicola sp.]
MNYKLINAPEFEHPLDGVPQLTNGKLWFPYIDYKKSGEKSYFGVMEYDLTSHLSKYVEAPFYTEDEYITANYMRIVMHPCLGDDFIVSLGWKVNYDIKYRFFRITEGLWFEIDVQKDAKNIVKISRDVKGNDIEPDSKLSLEKHVLDGGMLYCWQEDDTTCFSTDDTHAFETDSSDFTDSKSSLENKLNEAAFRKSNLDYMRLTAYLKKHKLPKDVPVNHALLNGENVHNFWVLKDEEHLFFLNSDFRKGGFTDLLHFSMG